MIAHIAPGARILVRDAEWIVRRADLTSSGSQSLSVVGISELVRGREAIFLSELEDRIEVLKPEDTVLVPDKSPNYRQSLLFMESQLRRRTPTGDAIFVGQKAAMDTVDYQFDPAVQALGQPRQRILIADATGLGKTLEAGILVSELIRRGRGKRILVIVLKSMLTQFQKEFWSRFTIPLVRLDSVGIQRVRSRIPTNHNPFFYYDRSIISIDTLKQDSEYRTYLEQAWWDIIVIDEAQNVAERGSSSSLRARLASLLARRSDTLIMLSATPHDGKARSFASLMNMLDPTAIADPDDYTREEIKGLFIRRFKKDIQDQVLEAFREREITRTRFPASAQEEEAFDRLTSTEFTKLDTRQTGSVLFKTTLQKALFSSPAACLETIRNRVRNLVAANDPGWRHDIESLNALKTKVEAITREHFSKYQKLLDLISVEQSWTGRDKTDRLVVFTERIETMRFLEKNLPNDLGLREGMTEVLHGGMSDIEQQRVVEDFGREEAGVRLLIASDVASEGINLHYLCHRMIHFDIPWSLMVFQQRNGRIDRYGQKNIPLIWYLITESSNRDIRGDTRILELLIRKDEQAVKNIGDPASFMHAYDIEGEELITAKAMESGITVEEFDEQLEKGLGLDPLAILLGHVPPTRGEQAAEKVGRLPSFYSSEYLYLKNALDHLNNFERITFRPYPDERRIDLSPPPDLKQRFRQLPLEVFPDRDDLVLVESAQAMQDEIANCRKQETAWPRMSYLWPLNPVIEWMNDRLTAAFGRHEAPIIFLPGVLEPGEVFFILSGLIPNLKGHPLVNEWFTVRFRTGHYEGTLSFEKLLDRTQLDRRVYPNQAAEIDAENLKALLPDAISRGNDHMLRVRNEFQGRMDEKLLQHLEELDKLKVRRMSRIEEKFLDSRQPERLRNARLEAEKREITVIFEEYHIWIKETMETEKQAWIQVMAVLTGERI